MSKVAFFELQDFRPQRTDWNRVIVELNGKGVSCALIADVIGASRKTVNDWKNCIGRGPPHDIGQAILAMHSRYCAKRVFAESIGTHPPPETLPRS